MNADKVKVSLIMATYNRYDDPISFLKSLKNSTYNLNQVEVIIVDQNENDELNKRISLFVEKENVGFKVLYKKIERKGLANARNFGLKFASGEIIAFPDDDCCYFSETLDCAYAYLLENTGVDAVMGRIVNKDDADIIRKWPKQLQRLTADNFYTKFSAVGWFMKRDCLLKLHFCEKLGTGTYFGSAEDADLLYNILLDNKVIIFLPTLKVYHPDVASVPESKIISYGRGFGAFCRKNWNMKIFMLFLGIIGYHFVLLLKNIIFLKKDETYKRYLFIYSRFQGFFRWRKHR